MKMVIRNMKEELKNLAVSQKEGKVEHKDNQRNSQEGACCCWDDKSEYVTVLHILYNRYRRRPAHCGSEEADEAYLSGENPELWMVPGILEELQEKYPYKELEPVSAADVLWKESAV